MWLEVLYWIDHVSFYREHVYCACDPSVCLDCCLPSETYGRNENFTELPAPP